MRQRFEQQMRLSTVAIGDVKRPFENNSVGILLCKGKDTEVVEYAMARNTSPALIADYETKLIPKKVLALKLHQLIEQLSREESH